MAYNPRIHHRRSVRLAGFDYLQPGDYFVTICTKNRVCIFGEVTNCDVQLSPVGEIVNQDWIAVPNHYSNVKLDAFRLMPNHIHGIVTIKERTKTKIKDSKHQKGDKRPAHSLSSLVCSYKSGVTNRLHGAGYFPRKSIWQSRFYDHIIRDDVSLYMIRQYIELNPLMWEFDMENPRAKGITLLAFESILKEKHGISGQALAMIMNSERMLRLSWMKERSEIR